MAEVDAAPSRDQQTQPHVTQSSIQQQRDNISDPSSSSNSTNMTGSQTNHDRSISSHSDASPPPPAEETKFSASNENSAPSSPTNELRNASADAPSSRPQHKGRTRSSSSGVLARLTSRSSSYISDHFVDSGSTVTSHGSVDSISKPKIDRAALAKPKGKYKSGVNWDSSVMNIAAGEEPFMEQIRPTTKISREEMEDLAKIAELEEMAAAGSTKAALAWSRANSFGDPLFTNHRRAMAQAAAMATLQGSSNTSSASAPNRMISAATRSHSDNSSRGTNLRYNNKSEMNGISEDAASKGEEGSRDGSPKIHTQDLISGVGQQVLHSARRAAAESNDAQEKQPSDETQASPSPSPPDIKAEEAQKAAKIAKRRTFLGFGGGKKEKKKGKSSTVPEEADDEAEASAKLAVPTEQVIREEEPRPNTNGTTTRRRRFNDTRQLDLLANELAAEALMGSPDSYPHVMPETRRASMMSMLVATNNDLGAASSKTSSQISLQQSGLNNLAMPQPAFVNEHARSGSPAGTGNSSLNGSPRMGGTDSPRFDPPRAPFARSQQSLNPPISSMASQKAKLTGLPADMLAGLGDGPYPTVFSREREASDSYVMPMSLEGGYEQANLSGRNSLHDGASSRSRRPSAGSGPMPKRSVLQMSMSNPESEMQGLTKPPKSSRSTPFGSRAPSKQVTPHASFGNLRDKANAAVSPTLLSSELAKSGAISKGNSPKEESNLQVPSSVVSDVSDEASAGSTAGATAKNDEGKKVRPGGREARRSFFGRKSKSKLREGEAENNDEVLRAPPLPTPASKEQSLHSNNTASNGMGGIGSRLLGASRSAHSLVKMPSPTQSHATTSASSHDRGAFGYSSDGGSQQQGISAVTTPEALPAKLELTSMPAPEIAVMANQSTPTGLPRSNSSLHPNPSSTLSPAPRSMSTASKTSTNTLGRISKFKSIFGSRPSSAAPRTPPITMNTTSNHHYNSEKGPRSAASPLSNGIATPKQAALPVKKPLKYYHSRMTDTTAV